MRRDTRQPPRPPSDPGRIQSFEGLSMDEIDRIVDEEHRLNRLAIERADRRQLELDEVIIANRLLAERILRSLRRRPRR